MWIDALQVGLVIGLITAWERKTLTRILLANTAREGRRMRRVSESYVIVERPRPFINAEDVRKAQRAAARAQKPRQAPQNPKATTAPYR